LNREPELDPYQFFALVEALSRQDVEIQRES
jgi:hypothetical protein